MNKEQLIKSLVLIFIIIFGSAVLVRTLMSGQTLSDYAKDNNIPIHSEIVEDEIQNDTAEEIKSDSK